MTTQERPFFSGVGLFYLRLNELWYVLEVLKSVNKVFLGVSLGSQDLLACSILKRIVNEDLSVIRVFGFAIVDPGKQAFGP